MKLSTRSRYGTRMMLDLAKHDAEGPVPVQDIAKRQEISVKYLKQLVIPLKKANFIRSVRGPKGGYVLARPAGDITIGDIVRLLEGLSGLVGCVERPESCGRAESCMARDVWKTATAAVFRELDGMTLSGLIEKSKGPA